MSRQSMAAGLSLLLCLSAGIAQAGNCADRDQVVERLQAKYDEQLTVGGLHETRSSQSVLEVWASRTTGTFTVLMTSPQGVSCIVASGTDYFEAEPSTEDPQGTAS
ncbi:MAG: hypothetical protein AB3N23_04585 [Paracoccaceae bacterium]